MQVLHPQDSVIGSTDMTLPPIDELKAQIAAIQQKAEVEDEAKPAV